MLINIIEVNVENELLSFIKQINDAKNVAWGLLVIDRQYLKEMTNSSFVMAIKPALMDSLKAEVFFLNNDEIYIFWSGHPAQISRNLREIITIMLREDVAADTNKIITYHDPQVTGDELSAALKARLQVSVKKPEAKKDIVFTYSEIQAKSFTRMQKQRLLRHKLHILIVEDQAFTRKLLSDVLKDSCDVDNAGDIEEGWRLYIANAPDIVFLDIELSGASGHLLAARIQSADPASFVIMLTSNNTVEDVQTAKDNKVAGFIAKPFSKQKINDCLNKYKASHLNITGGSIK